MKPAWQYRPGPDIATTPPMGLSQAQALAKAATQIGLAALKPGVSEREIEKVIHDYLYQKNAAGIWTITTVGLGENARVCFPTQGPGELTTQEKDVLIVDVHPITEQGFWGDCTRTRVIGHYPEADQALRDLERIHQHTLTLCRPGMPAGELFEISHQQLLKEGFILLDLLGNIGHSLGAGSAYTEGFIDASNIRPMWGAWAIEPFAQRGDVAVKVEDLVWFGRDTCTVL